MLIQSYKGILKIYLYYILLSTIILLLIIDKTSAQQQQQQIIPTSPEAAALTKMVNYPVNMNTGVPDISIPLYTIETGGLSLPIGLSYHAGGFKIHEQATSVGLGWSLTSDIQITRTINGNDDLLQNGYIYNTKMKTYYDMGTGSGYDYPLYDPSSGSFPDYNAYQIAAGETDGMPDKFNYRLLNKSGSFYFRKNQSGSSYTIVPIPYDDIKITYDGRFSFTIVDTDGSIYVFGGTGSTLDPDNRVNLALEISDGHQTTWKCKTITNATETETIQFSYQTKTPVNFYTGTSSIDYYNNDNPCGLGKYFTADQISLAHPGISSFENLISLYPFYSLSSPKFIEYSPYGYSVFHLPYLNSMNQVSDKTYKLETSSSGGGTSGGHYGKVYGILLSRIDFRGGSVFFNGTDELKSIQVKNLANEEIKTFSFFQSYAVPMSVDFAKRTNGDNFMGTRYLDSVQFKANNISYETYRLKYESKYCFGNHLQGKDAWGYPNLYTREWGEMDDRSGVPLQKKVQRFYKDVSFCSYVDNLTFTFGNSFNLETADPAALKYGILKRVIYPTGGYVDFGYETNMYRQNVTNNLMLTGMGGGLRVKSINYFDGKSPTPVSQKYYRYGEMEDGIGLLINSPAKNYNLESRSYDAYSYSQTTGYLTGPPSSNLGSNFDPIPGSCYTRNCLYFRFKEKKTTYVPASSVDYTFPSGAPIYYTKVTEYNQDLGLASGKKVYTFYKPDYFMPYSLNMAKISGTNIDVLQTDGLMGKQKLIEEYKYENGKYTLIHSKSSLYTKYSKSEQIRVVYAYFNTIYKVIGGSFNGSNKDFYNTSYSFAPGSLMPSNDIASGEYGIQVGKLLLNSEVEKWVNGLDTIRQSTAYKYNNTLYTQPSQITTSTGTNVRSQSFKYAYDFPGNAVYDQMKTKNMISQVIDATVRDDNENKEIARTVTNYKTINAGFGFIAPISVEKSVGGNALETILGYEYDAYGNIVQLTEKNKLVSSYIWGYGYKYPVAKINGATYSSATSGINITTFQNFNETQIKATLIGVRNALPNAMVTSFTYKPMMGVSSETAPNGKSKFYDYDPYGRLSTIKDDSLQILSRYDYMVTGPTTSYVNSYGAYNTPMMLTYNKTCGETMRMVNVIQEGGTQSASDLRYANSLAENYLENNWSTISGAVSCSKPTASVLFKFANWSTVAYPMADKVYIDFIKDDVVVASKKMGRAGTSSEDLVKLYIEPGIYRISIRLNDNYNRGLLKFDLWPSTGTGGPLKSGDVINCQPGAEYSLAMYNQ